MKIAKLNHSCLAIEHNGISAIIDPGMYSLDLLDVSEVPSLDYLLITHEHQDHFDLPLVKSLAAKFPQVKIITTNSAREILAKEGLQVFSTGDANIQVTPIQHEKIWMGHPVENVMVTLFDKLTHPGDSLSFSETAEVLALPITAPWGSTTWAVDVATKLKPKVIIPIHDWHWKDEVRKSMYQRLAQHFAPLEIAFKPIETGDIVEV